MSDDERRPEPNTVPPPKGAKDMYSAPTRIGTLPEEVLAAMRAEASDATLASRTSVMESAALERLRPPPPASEIPAVSVTPVADVADVAEESAAEDEPAPRPPLSLSTPHFGIFALGEPSRFIRPLLVIAIAVMIGALAAAALTLW